MAGLAARWRAFAPHLSSQYRLRTVAPGITAPQNSHTATTRRLFTLRGLHFGEWNRWRLLVGVNQTPQRHCIWLNTRLRLYSLLFARHHAQTA